MANITRPTTYGITHDNETLHSYLDRTTLVVESIDALRITEPVSERQIITVAGYYDHTPGEGGGQFWYHQADKDTPDNGVTVIVTPDGARWKRMNVSVLHCSMAGMVPSATPDVNSEAYERLLTALPYEGGMIQLGRGTYQVKYGLMVPPRTTVQGEGMDSTIVKKMGNEIKQVTPRLWQGRSHEYSVDFLAALDMDSDTTGDLSGTQTRSGRIRSLSLVGAGVAKAAFGIFSGISYDVRMDDLYIKNVAIGIRTSDSWLWTLSNITIQDVSNKGVYVEAGGTTFNLSNVYVKTITGIAFHFYNATYSTLTNCAADFVTGSSYAFLNCTGITLNGCGNEEVTGLQFEVNGSHLVINGFRGVNINQDTQPTLIFTSTNVTMNNCFFPEYKGGMSGKKYWRVGNTTVNLVSTVVPGHIDGAVEWGVENSQFNYTQWDGMYTIFGNNTYVVAGSRVLGIPHLRGDAPPQSSVTHFPVGTEWALSKPQEGQAYKWVYIGDGQWKVISTVQA